MQSYQESSFSPAILNFFPDSYLQEWNFTLAHLDQPIKSQFKTGKLEEESGGNVQVTAFLNICISGEDSSDTARPAVFKPLV